MISNSVPILFYVFMDLNTYCPGSIRKSTLKTTKPAIQESTNPVLSNENPPQIRPLFVYQQPFLEPPKIQNFNWE